MASIGKHKTFENYFEEKYKPHTLLEKDIGKEFFFIHRNTFYIAEYEKDNDTLYSVIPKYKIAKNGTKTSSKTSTDLSKKLFKVYKKNGKLANYLLGSKFPSNITNKIGEYISPSYSIQKLESASSNGGGKKNRKTKKHY